MILHVKTLFIWLALFGLVACGGGGSVSRDDSAGGGTGGSTDPVTISMQLAFTDASGQPSTELSESSPLTLTTTVTDSNGNPVTNTLVTFSFQPEGLAVFGNDAGTASTDSNGVATIDILVGENSGAGQITATLSSGETATTTFNSAGIVQISEQPASLELFGSSTQLASSGSDEIELIALAKDANNVLLEGIDVTFSANADASIQVTQGTTGPDGIARALLTTQNNAENREIIVTARTGTFAPFLKVKVTGTQIDINGSSSAILNDSVPLTINLLDSDGSGIANKEVVIRATNGQLSEPGSDISTEEITLTTSVQGQIPVIYTGTVAGVDEIFADALNTQGKLEITVQEDDFSFQGLLSDGGIQVVDLNTEAEITVKWLKNGVPYVDGDVILTTSRGQIIQSANTTDSNGDVKFLIQSDNAGFASITATGLDELENEVSARAQIEFVATEADNIIVDSTPDSVGPNGQTSTITSVLRDPQGNLVKNKVINFMVDDVSGGTISPNQAITNSSGIASTVYTSNAVSSFEAVKVYATVADTPSVSDFTSLTVGDRAFDISIGTGSIIEAPEQSVYSKEFTVFVTDPNSNPVPNAMMTFSAPPVKFSNGGTYRKGTWNYNDVKGIWEEEITAVCANEDINGNGILDVGEDANNNGIFDPGEDTNGDGVFDRGEDTNGDGQLTPGNVVSIPSSGTTDENGQTLIKILYAKQFGNWVDVDILAKAESAGSESAENQKFALPVAGVDLIDEATQPPNSPFGVGTNCNDTN